MLLSTTTKGQLTDVFSKLLLDFKLRKKIYGICKHTTIAFIEFFIGQVRTNIFTKYSRVINRKLSGIVYSWKNDYRGGILSTRCRTTVLQNKKKKHIFRDGTQSYLHYERRKHDTIVRLAITDVWHYDQFQPFCCTLTCRIEKTKRLIFLNN